MQAALPVIKKKTTNEFPREIRESVLKRLD